MPTFTNDYLPFSASSGSDNTPQDQYLLATWRVDGWRSGILPHQQINKVLRQTSVISAAVAQVISDVLQTNMVDDGNVSALAVKVRQTFGAAGSAFDPNGTYPAGSVGAFMQSLNNDGAAWATANGLKSILAGALTESQLTSSLNNRLNLIDASGTGLVTKVQDLQTAYGSTASAATSASQAASSAADAINAKNLAQTKAGEAATSATNASNSATTATSGAATATTKAGEATTAASSATASAATASTSAGAAATSASNASGSASAASTSASSAATSSGNAGTYASSAQTAANTATTKAGEASTSASSAATSATSASGSASTATTKANLAAASADAASTSAGQASTSASGAATSASNAAGSASSAATSSGTAASSASAAAGSAGTAATQASNASNSAGAASTSASQASTSASNASGSASAANTSAIAAANSASAAGGSASAAAGSASTASTQATNASNSASAANSSATAAASSAGAASTSAGQASTSESNAAGSASSASTNASSAATSATNAGNSATAANSSASSASTSATNANNSAVAAAGWYTSTVSATGSLTAAVNQEATTRAAETGVLNAQYVLKVSTTRSDGKQVFAGLGLASQSIGNISQSEILLVADRLVFATPGNENGSLTPLMTVGNSGGLSNQVIIRSAIIGDLTVDTLKIANNAVTVPIYWELGSDVTYSGFGEQTLATMASGIDFKSAPIYINIYYQLSANTGPFGDSWIIRVRVDGTEVARWDFFAPGGSTALLTGSRNLQVSGAAGSRTFTLTAEPIGSVGGITLRAKSSTYSNGSNALMLGVQK